MGSLQLVPSRAIHYTTITEELLVLKKLKKFYGKRILRIFPLYWIAFAMYIPMLWWLGRLSNPTIVDFLATLTGTQILLDPAFISFRFPVLWYIGMITLLYLIYPFLILFSKNNKEILIKSLPIF
ncbi:MAG TPA: hypothetical protein EYP30_05795 [Archaeoglobaceae archaeon]|nr:hypothetical protein [Archaeoglobaceae archaeon]